MKTKTMAIEVLFTISILIMLPSISAMQYNVVEQKSNAFLYTIFKDVDNNLLEDTLSKLYLHEQIEELESSPEVIIRNILFTICDSWDAFDGLLEEIYFALIVLLTLLCIFLGIYVDPYPPKY